MNDQTTINVPIIETQRLILRLQREADWPDYFSFMSSGRARYMGGPYTKTSAWGQFCHDVAQWSLMGHGALMIEGRECGRCLGQVGINHGPLFPERELGWFVYEHAEGNGFAFEAANALRQWAFEVRRYSSLVSYIDPDNTRSLSLALRLGAHLDADAPGLEENDLVYRHSNA